MSKQRVNKGQQVTAPRGAGLRLFSEPDLASLRRAIRVALVVPAAFAVALRVVGNPQITTFVVFGCFALLVMSDFGGLRGPRALAYVSTTLMGVVLVAFGTVMSSNVVT